MSNKKSETNLDLETTEVSNKKVQSREEKKAARRAGMQESGRLNLPDEYKEKGYRYRVCNVLPGNIENYMSQGYEVVTHSLTSGSGLSNEPEVNGNPQEFEVGRAKGSMKAIWMRISDEDASILDEIRDEDAKEQDKQIRVNPVPVENQYGTVTKENLK